MKATLIQEHLAKALSYINKAVSTRPSIPVLANVLIESEKGRLKLSATNLEIGISTWIGAEIMGEGKVTVSARLLADFINSLKSGKIELTQTEQTLVVKSVDNNAEFFIIPAEDFPILPVFEEEAVVTLNAHAFADSIYKTAFAAGVDDSKPVMTGLLFQTEGSTLTMVGLDNHRLSRKILKLDDAPKADLSEIVPAKALSEVEKIIRDVASEKDNVKIYMMKQKNQLMIKIGEIEFITRLIEGKYPNYAPFVPAEKILHLRAKKQEFADALKVVNIFARNVLGNKMKFALKDNKLTLSASVIDMGHNESSFKVIVKEGDEFETAFNARFLSDLLGVLGGEEIIFETKSASSPGVFLDPADEGFIHIIMPIRLS